MFFLLSAFAIHRNQQNCNLIMAQNGQQNQRMTKVIRFLKSQIFNLLGIHINSDVSQKMSNSSPLIFVKHFILLVYIHS